MTDPQRIATPTDGPGGLDAQRSAHFGHADSFTIVDVVDGAIVAAEAVENPPQAHGGCGLVVQTLADAGVDVAIVVGMGGGPRAAMQTHRIEALYDADSPTPRTAVESYLAGGASSFGGDHVCNGH